jgi:hypothetical protein
MCSWLLLAALAPASLDVPALLREADSPRHAIEEGVMRLRVTVSESDRPEVHESVLDVYVRGADRVLCVFREGRQKDRKILVSGDRAWLLVPGVSRAVPISASQRLLGGASVADVARLRFSDFTAELVGEEVLSGTPCLVLELTARARGAPYASGRLWVGREDHLPRRARLALRSGREAKEIRFVEYDRQGGQSVLRRMEVQHLLSAERGAMTVLEFIDYEPRPLAADFFEPASARELR